MDPPAAQSRGANRLAGACHPACVVCGTANENGLGLHFERQPDGTVVGRFGCDASYQSYPDRLHGGVVSMLLDAAMTNCLFAHEVQAVTARLNVRFRQPVRLGREAVVCARLVERLPPLYLVEAELHQDGAVCAAADAKFYSEQTDGGRQGCA
jgi:acyl-coenzyme A thioesterase PaaI-like protein